MVVGVLDFRLHLLRYSIAGHLPLPLLLSGEGAVYLTGEGSPVGLLPNAQFNEQQLNLPETFILSLFSDGILELLEEDDLIAKEQSLLARLNGPVVRPSVLSDRLGIKHVDQDALPDDVAALFISRGLA
jgi:serine phosphatase RsbU (regulator of sigma subunit)